MAILTREDAPVEASARKRIDLIKVLTWIAAAVLPWGALVFAAKLVVDALT